MCVKAVSVTCLKKMLLIVDKSKVTKVCVDDFALRKRYTYGTFKREFNTRGFYFGWI